jgi:hypothetical protein
MILFGISLVPEKGKGSGALDHPKQPGYLHWGPGPPQSVVCSSASYCNKKCDCFCKPTVAAKYTASSSIIIFPNLRACLVKCEASASKRLSGHSNWG